MVTTEDFILKNRNADVATLALQRNRYPDVDIDFALQQIEGYQRAKDKLPTLSQIDGWWFPPRLNIEQCSSEQSAHYKSSLLSGKTLIDLTGGYGVDCYFLSRNFLHTDYVELSSELCRIAEHNFRLLTGAITVHQMDCTDYLKSSPSVDCIYIDPARRGKMGNKVVRLEDCLPNVVEIYPLIKEHCKVLLLKLSPMLDIDTALRALPDAQRLHIVEVNGEVKELLILCNFAEHSPLRITAAQLTAIGCKSFSFTPEEEKNAVCPMADRVERYIYEPAPSILKAGAFKTVGDRYKVLKWDNNTHLYTSEHLVQDFPGRVFKVVERVQKKDIVGTQANLLTRNYPQDTMALRKSLRLRDGGSRYIIGARLAGLPLLILAERLQ